jgi:hypothetical protein
MTKAVRGAGTLACAVILVAASVSCGDMARDGQASSFLIISSLEAASGADTTPIFGGDLRSDVITVVDGSATIFNDLGRVNFTLEMKDPSNLTGPTSANFITIDRYRVAYVRSDGHNVEGVDVPYTFDGAITGTVANTATFSFTIVRHQAKQEAPLRTLGTNGILVSTIAEITFYGHDQTGRAVSVTGRIGISFGNFGDPV